MIELDNTPVCTGCGTRGTDDEIRRRWPNGVTCCPERRTVPAHTLKPRVVMGLEQYRRMVLAACPEGGCGMCHVCYGGDCGRSACPCQILKDIDVDDMEDAQ